jgi:uncharacterized protein YybS (DUF2232 family)
MSGSSSDSPEKRSADPSSDPSVNRDMNPDMDWDDALAAMEIRAKEPAPTLETPHLETSHLETPHLETNTPPVELVETSFLASATTLLYLVGYYLNLSPWLRILYPIPIALIYLRWRSRAAWMGALVTALLMAVLMGPFVSVLFFIPYGFLGIHLGFLWQRRAGWGISIGTGAILATLSMLFRFGLLSVYLGEDLWLYINNRVVDVFQWIVDRLVDWNLLGIDALGVINPALTQVLMVLILFAADVVYLFTIHLAGWLLLERLGNPIPEPPEWVQSLLIEE